MAIDDRFQLSLDHFGRAVTRLQEALAQPQSEFVRDSVIQRFEFSFEAGWKAAYRWLRARDNDLDEEAYVVIPEAFKRRLISDEQGWGRMRKYRNLTSHTYNEALADEVAQFIRQTGAPLLAALHALLQERADE